ncbi:MAG: DUF488 domain-containing protein [Cyanobacteria bacterium SZAS LIN-2]|nr:DUF488 domain-containing protein [Cyanobacteria bacterium SZAS LIN-2]
MVVFTIGYEGLSPEDFVALLEASRIEYLVDIREAPVSRKAAFSKDPLARRLEAAGIAYAHHRALGCPKPIRDRYGETGDWARYTQDFKHYLAGQSAALRELRKVATSYRTCLLCYEANPERCHRSYVAEDVIAESPGAIHHIPVSALSPQGSLAL